VHRVVSECVRVVAVWIAKCEAVHSLADQIGAAAVDAAAPTATTFLRAMIIDEATDGLGRGVERLIRSGARNIIVLDLRDIGGAPQLIKDRRSTLATSLRESFNAQIDGWDVPRLGDESRRQARAPRHL
jgi:phospholipase/lecithinase/hemolysin